MWQAGDGNLLTFDKTDGGLARWVGWLNMADGSSAGNNGDGTLTLAEDTGIATAYYPAGVAISPMLVQPGANYVAAVTCDRLVAVGVSFIYGDGTVSAATWGFGTTRAAVSVQAPANSVSAIVSVFAPTARVTSAGSTTEAVTFWDITEMGAWAFLADSETPGPVTLSGVVFVHGNTDPGPLDPAVVDTTFGQRVWTSLPQMYVDYDKADTRTGLPLSKFLHGLFAQVDDVEAVRDQILAGQLTDPTQVPDKWVSWLAQIVGAPITTIANTRSVLQSQQTGPAVGTRQYLRALGKSFLTGTKVCDVFPNPVNRWELAIRVRTDQLGLVTDAAGFKAAMIATGQVPAGFLLRIVTGLPLWSDIDGFGDGTWGGLDRPNPRWSDIDSIGVSGI